MSRCYNQYEHELFELIKNKNVNQITKDVNHDSYKLNNFKLYLMKYCGAFDEADSLKFGKRITRKKIEELINLPSISPRLLVERNEELTKRVRGTTWSKNDVYWNKLKQTYGPLANAELRTSYFFHKHGLTRTIDEVCKAIDPIMIERFDKINIPYVQNISSEQLKQFPTKFVEINNDRAKILSILLLNFALDVRNLTTEFEIKTFQFSNQKHQFVQLTEEIALLNIRYQRELIKYIIENPELKHWIDELDSINSKETDAKKLLNDLLTRA